VLLSGGNLAFVFIWSLAPELERTTQLWTLVNLDRDAYRLPLSEYGLEAFGIAAGSISLVATVVIVFQTAKQSESTTLSIAVGPLPLLDLSI